MNNIVHKLWILFFINLNILPKYIDTILTVLKSDRDNDVKWWSRNIIEHLLFAFAFWGIFLTESQIFTLFH
jgi:hypothetical protein